MSARRLQTRVPAIETSDGAGVRLRRALGGQPGLDLDPFLLLDEFSSDDPDDYIAGFPSHPHRGFETVTLMLDGVMRHEDHLGHRSDLGPGDVQWMRAGRGIIHSEMPQQRDGRMRGFQLWINLPAEEKMDPAEYRDLTADRIPQVRLDGGGTARVIAGRFEHDDGAHTGAMHSDPPPRTEPLLVDLRLNEGESTGISLPAGKTAMVYVYEGGIRIGSADEPLPAHHLGVLTDGNSVELNAGETGARALLLAGRPLREPVARYGPFVMNTPGQIRQAIEDYQHGRLTG